MSRRIPADKLVLFKVRLGRELDEKELIEHQDKRMITVGDVVSLTVRRNGIVPVLSIYDGMTERHEITGFADLVETQGLEVKVVSNPAGEVTDGLVDAIKQSIPGKPQIIRVEGEEDLALMPCILYAPDGYEIVYGWPGKGMMLVTTDGIVREQIEQLWKEMEVIE
ncbi:MAG: GTP-dependent dephospho-CoA kinase family protein [Candidatus Methanomethylophilaceae archaeon]|nr:GTP-dependent dephospho-CoA kinase family protein [Candidatus Methanomethylophilaceae archaeon]